MCHHSETRFTTLSIKCVSNIHLKAIEAMEVVPNTAPTQVLDFRPKGQNTRNYPK